MHCPECRTVSSIAALFRIHRSRPWWNHRDAVPPRTPTEETMAAIWRHMLGISHLGIHDNFFELGGHSLLATQVISRMRMAFDIPLELRAIFDRRPLPGWRRRSSARYRSRRPATIQNTAIQAVARDGPLPLSFAQQRLWFLDRWNSGNGLYNIPAAFTLVGPAARGRARAISPRPRRASRGASNALPDRRRTPGSNACCPRASLNLSVVDLADRPLPIARSVAVRHWSAQEARRGFDLAHGPLIRALLFDSLTTEHVLRADAASHRALTPGRWRSCFASWSVLYRALVAGTTPRFPPLLDFSIRISPLGSGTRFRGVARTASGVLDAPAAAASGGAAAPVRPAPPDSRCAATATASTCRCLRKRRTAPGVLSS